MYFTYSSSTNQQVTTTFDSSTGRGGTYAIKVHGQEARVAWDVSAADLELALESLCTVRDVTVTRNIVEHGHT